MDKSKIQNLNPQEYTHLPHAEQHFEDHEQTDVAIKPLVITLICIALLMVVSMIGMWGLFHAFRYWTDRSAENQPLSTITPDVRHVPEGFPELQGVPAKGGHANSPAQDWKVMHDHYELILKGDAPLRTGLANGHSIEESMDKALASGVFKTATAVNASPATQASH